jgi:hypothetical protein
VHEPSSLPGDPTELRLRISYDDEFTDTPQTDTLERWKVSILHRRRTHSDPAAGRPDSATSPPASPTGARRSSPPHTMRACGPVVRSASWSPAPYDASWQPGETTPCNGPYARPHALRQPQLLLRSSLAHGQVPGLPWVHSCAPGTVPVTCTAPSGRARWKTMSLRHVRTAPQSWLGVPPPFPRPARRRLRLLCNSDIERYLVVIGPMVGLWPPSGDGLNPRLGEDQSFEKAGELIP